MRARGFEKAHASIDGHVMESIRKTTKQSPVQAVRLND